MLYIFQGIQGQGFTYTVYLGLQDSSLISTGNISPAVSIIASRVIVVRYFDFFQYWHKLNIWFKI